MTRAGKAHLNKPTNSTLITFAAAMSMRMSATTRITTCSSSVNDFAFIAQGSMAQAKMLFTIFGGLPPICARFQDADYLVRVETSPNERFLHRSKHRQHALVHIDCWEM